MQTPDGQAALAAAEAVERSVAPAMVAAPPEAGEGLEEPAERLAAGKECLRQPSGRCYGRRDAPADPPALAGCRSVRRSGQAYSSFTSPSQLCGRYWLRLSLPYSPSYLPKTCSIHSLERSLDSCRAVPTEPLAAGSTRPL